MDTPVVLLFYVNPSSNLIVIRSVLLKEYFSKLTSNVEVLYPTQIHCGLLLCKSKRTEEKIFKMSHVLPNGSTIHLSQLPRQLFQHTKCLIDAQTMQSNGISAYFQQCLPFLHASGGNTQVNTDGSVSLEGHVYILNSIHSFVVSKTSKQRQSNSSNTSESFDLRSGGLSVKVMSGKLIDQNVESIIIPVNDKYKIHKAFDRQIQSSGGTTLSSYLKELITKGARPREGEIILFPNRELKIPAKLFITFVVPRLSANEGIKDKTMVDAFQPTYEQIIYRALQTIDQNNITSIAMPILEPSVKTSAERRHATEMAARAMVSAIRQFSQNSSVKLKRIVIVDHQIQIKRMSKRVKKYQNQTKLPTGNNIDLDKDDGHSFANIFGIPKLPEVVGSSSNESDDEMEPEEYSLPYIDHAKS